MIYFNKQIIRIEIVIFFLALGIPRESKKTREKTVSSVIRCDVPFDLSETQQICIFRESGKICVQKQCSDFVWHDRYNDDFILGDAGSNPAVGCIFF